MTAALLVTTDENLGSRIRRELGNCSVFMAQGMDDALRVLGVTETDLVILDGTPARRELAHFVARARHLSPSAVVVCLQPADELASEDWEDMDSADFLLLKPFTSQNLASVLRQADAKRGLLLELSALRARQSSAAAVMPESSSTAPAPVSPIAAAVVKELARSHASGLDPSRVLESFLDAVGEMLKFSRAALLLPNDARSSFSVAAHRGLAGHLAREVRLAAGDGLPRWLEMHGRVIQAAEAARHAEQALAREVARDLALLKAVVAVPLLAHGEIVAILTVGRRVTGAAYAAPELDLLFDLASQVASAIREIQLRQRLEYQRVYIEQILAHMSSGLITIDRQEKVSMMNRRAEETLGLGAREVLNRDLRLLPSPLGDLLYESLRTSRRLEHAEIQLAQPKLPLAVSTYPLVGHDDSPLGAALIFDDLSGAKRLAAERRQNELFELLTRVVARMADEIKGPLVSVRTFMELLDEQVDQVEFRQRFAAVAGRDVGRLLEVVEKISALVNDGEFKFEGIDAREMVEECLAELGAQTGAEVSDGKRIVHFTDWGSGKRASVSIQAEGDELTVKGDRSQLKRAVTYLLWYLMRKSPGEESQLSISIARSNGVGASLHLLVSSRSAELDAGELDRIFDPLKAVEHSLIDVGPFISQRIIEAHGGRLQANQARREVSFPAELPLALM